MTLTEQFATMLAMAVTGLWFGPSLTAYHRFMQPKKRNNWVLLIADLFFWVFQGLLVFYVLLYVNEGQIRLYMFLSMALGFATYKALFETIFKNFLETIIIFVVRVCRVLKNLFHSIFVQPAFALLSLLAGLGMIVGRFILAFFKFLLSAVFKPFNWLFKWIIPDSWLNAIKWFNNSIRSRIIKVIKWFKSD